MSRDLAPALVSSPDDIVEYLVEDASAIDPNAPAGFIERYIHSEAMKRYPTINSVLHSHTEAVLPFGVVDVPLLPVVQVGAVMGERVPVLVFDIADYFLPSDSHILLVRNARFGAALAALISNSTNSSSPVNNLVLMRGHGMAFIGPDIVNVVFGAISTRINAEAQRDALILGALGGSDGQPGMGGRVQYLSAREIQDIIALGTSFYGRAWELWVRQVEAAQAGELYRNSLGSPIGNQSGG